MILYLALILQNWVLPIPHFVAAGLLLVALAIFALFSPVKSKYFGVAQQLILNAYNKVSVSLFRYRGIFWFSIWISKHLRIKIFVQQKWQRQPQTSPCLTTVLSFKRYGIHVNKEINETEIHRTVFWPTSLYLGHSFRLSIVARSFIYIHYYKLFPILP